MGSSAELCLRWSSYESTLLLSVCDMWDAGALTDVTLFAEGRTIKAHKVVLSSCSGYFKEVLQDVTSAQHPIIVLPYACYQDLLAVISFMYKGEINITQLELSGLLNCAESLQVKGLAKINPLRASGLLKEVCKKNSRGTVASHGLLGGTSIKMEPHQVWKNNGLLPHSEGEEAVEITEISEECLMVEEDSPENMLEEVEIDSECHDSEEGEGGNESSHSGSERSEGKLYFLTSLGQHEEMKDEDIKKSSDTAKQIKNRRRKRGDLIRAINAAWNCGRGGMKECTTNNGQRSSIRKTLLPVSCPICFKVLSNAYNLKVHMSIHDGLKHQCSICGHTSKSRDALRKHLAYRHLIGMSGPVRPRMPANKRRKHDGTDDMLDTSMQSTENENQIAAASSLSFSDPDNDHLAHSGGEDVDQNGNPSVANDTW